MEAMVGRGAEAGSVPPAGVVRDGRVAYRVSLEGLLWAVLIVAAAVSRFVDLGSRALHHDESLHAKYGWDFFQGSVYQQDPLMHGPFMFHTIAASFWLFGDTDAAARIPAALFGVIMVGLPVLLRRELGRGGALLLSALLLISPGYLYFSRFIREDIFTAVAMFLFVAALVKFIARPSTRSIIWLGGAIGFFTTTKEIYFLEFALFGLFLAVWLLWQLQPRLLLIFGAYLIIALLAVSYVMMLAPYPQLDTVQSESQAWSLFLNQVLPHPLTLTIATVLVLGIGVAWFALREVAVARKDYFVRATAALGSTQPSISAAQALFLPYEEGSVAYAFGWLGRHKGAFGVGALFGFGIYSLFYTTFFANIPGEAGLLRSLGYWIAQQGVERGSQPWYYYFLLVPLYEPLAVLFGVIGAAYFGTKFVRYSLRARRDNPQPASAWPSAARRVQHPYFFEMALIVWGVGNLAVYTWASEKMPWLMLHIALPFMLLAALLLARMLCTATSFWNSAGRQAIVGRWLTRRRIASAMSVGLAVILVAYLRLFSTLSNPSPENIVTKWGWPVSFDLSGTNAWVWTLTSFIIIVLLVVGVVSLVVGWRAALTAAGLALAALLCVFLVHTGTNYAYDHPDTPIEMGIYVQTAPDVVRMSQELDNLTMMLNGQKDMKILYDTEVSWPLEWYLRNYPNRKKVIDIPQPGDTSGINVKDYPVIAVIDWKTNGTAQENHQQMAAYATDYYARHYVLRWWYPEEPYRNLVPVSVAQRAYLEGRASVTDLAYTRPDGTSETIVRVGQEITAAMLARAESARLLDNFYRSTNGPALNRPTVSTQQVMRLFLLNKQSAGSLRNLAGQIVVNVGEQMSDAVLDKAESAKGLEKLYAMNGGHVLTDMLAWTAASTGNLGDSAMMQSRLFRYFGQREAFQPLQSYDFTLYIRKDVAARFRAYGDLVEQNLNPR